MGFIETFKRFLDHKDQEAGSFNGLLDRFESLANGREVSHYGLDLFLQTNLNKCHARFPNQNSGFKLLFYTFRNSYEDPKRSEYLIGSLSWQIPIVGHWLDAINCQIIIHPDRRTTKTVYVAGVAETDNLLIMKQYVLGEKPDSDEKTIDFPGGGFRQIALKAGILPYPYLPSSLDIPGAMQGVINLARQGKPRNIREVLGISSSSIIL